MLFANTEKSAFMNSTSPLTARFPWSFIGIAFGISWGCWFFAALTGADMFENLEVGLIVVLGGFGPAVAGIIMVYRTRDSAIIREYWNRVFDPKRIRPPWYGVVLLLYPATVLLTFLFLGRFPDASPLPQIMRNPGWLFTTLVFVFLFGPLSEELGWRDYALDWLQARYSALWSSLILGFIWWAWHLPLLWVTGSFLYETGHDPVFLAGYLYVVLIYSILFTWVYNNSRRSVLSVILFHFSINLTSRVIVMSPEIFTYNSFILLLVAGGVIYFHGPQHLRRRRKEAPPGSG